MYRRGILCDGNIFQVQQNKIYLTNDITSYIDISHGNYAKANLAAIT